MNTQQSRRGIEPLDYQGMVEEFMTVSGQVVNKLPTELTTDLSKLRYALFIEEVEELRAAIEAGDRVEMLDAVCDINYILLGTAATVGENVNEEIITYLKMNATAKLPQPDFVKNHIPDMLKELSSFSVLEVEEAIRVNMKLALYLGFSHLVLQEAFKRVHASNMTKFFYKDEPSEVINDTVKKYTEEGVMTYLNQVGDYMVIYRHPDGKILKSINYKPVDLNDLV